MKPRRPSIPELFSAQWQRTGGDIIACIRTVLDAHAIEARRKGQQRCGLDDDRLLIEAKALATLVAHEFGLTAAEVFGPSRHAIVCRVRFLAMWIVREECGLSYPEIGRLFGRRDHTTVISACKNARVDMLANPATESRLLRLAKQNSATQVAA